MKTFIIILFILLTLKSAADWFFNNTMIKSMKGLLEVSEIHQLILQKQHDEISYLSAYQIEMEEKYYQVAELAILTQLKCNIAIAEQ